MKYKMLEKSYFHTIDSNLTLMNVGFWHLMLQEDRHFSF